jgi:hypothetical protein
MRFLDIDVDLILLALTVVFIVATAQPPRQPPVEVPTICVDTACYPASLVSPGRSASEDGRASATSIPLVGPIMAGKPVVVTPAELRHADFEPQLPAP